MCWSKCRPSDSRSNPQPWACQLPAPQHLGWQHRLPVPSPQKPIVWQSSRTPWVNATSIMISKQYNMMQTFPQVDIHCTLHLHHSEVDWCRQSGSTYVDFKFVCMCPHPPQTAVGCWPNCLYIDMHMSTMNQQQMHTTVGCAEPHTHTHSPHLFYLRGAQHCIWSSSGVSALDVKTILISSCILHMATWVMHFTNSGYKGRN